MSQVTKNISDRVDRFPLGFVFTYDDFIQDVDSKEATIKALNRMAISGRISKLSKGRFYKPEKGKLGELPPPVSQVVKDLLESDGKVIGYITGYSIFNKLGLTSQISNKIQIGKREIRPSLQRGYYSISFIKQKNIITKSNIYFLQLLDSIRLIKKIPDSDTKFILSRLLSLIDELNIKEIEIIIKLALKYPPSTRAILGVLMSQKYHFNVTTKLKKSLNPITTYQLEYASKVLKDTEYWNIQ